MNKLLFLVAEEILSLRHDFIYALVFLKTADRMTLIFALSMILGLFMPWYSHEKALETGFSAGLHGHLLLALWAIFWVRKTFLAHLADNDLRSLPIKLRRIALMYLFTGLLSVLISIGVLAYFLSIKSSIEGVLDIRLGFYLTTVSGLCILFCGLERFYSQN